MDNCRIILADDHTLIRRGLRKMLEEESSLEVVGEVGDGLELLDFLEKFCPDLVLLDITMPNLGGIEAIPQARKICPEIRILILTMHKNEQYLCSALQAGANGYLLKEDSDTELLPAIEQVMEGHIYISPFWAEDFAEDVLLSCAELHKPSGDPLTSRERQILKLVAEGTTSKEIAAVLSISKRTVDHHRANIMRKLNVRNTADLINYAIQKGYITHPT
jgi:DNA-binding NarL/FixJ family response regulator